MDVHVTNTGIYILYTVYRIISFLKGPFNSGKLYVSCICLCTSFMLVQACPQEPAFHIYCTVTRP